MAIKRIGELGVYEYQQNIKDKDLSAPPEIPAEGDRYIVGASATGAWVGKEGQIAWFYNSAWQFDIPGEGWTCWVNDEDKRYFHNGTVWGVEFPDGDMLKSVYDTNADGIVDKAAFVDDGAGNVSSAAAVKDTVTLAHANTLDHSNSLDHAQGTDQGLDTGGANAITAAQAKESYDRRGSYNSSLKAVVFDLP